MLLLIVRRTDWATVPDRLAGAMETPHPLAGRRQSFGALLRRNRTVRGLTQEALADRAGLSVRNLRDLERGAPQRPHHATIERLAIALALSPVDHAEFAVAAQRQGGVVFDPAAPTAVTALPFVGRAQELALLEPWLRGEGPPVLLLAGEPGIGKTRLLQVAAPQAIGHGLVVLEGGCHRRGGQEPYAPLLAALKGYFARRTPGQQRTALRGCAWLVRLLPELADGPIEPLPAWTLSPEQERRLMFEAVVRVLINVAELNSGGILVILDDLQWAGSDALDLLMTLARSAADIPLRLLGAYRDTEVGPQDLLSVMLGDLAQAGLAVRRLLGPLAPEEAGQLLAALRVADSREESEDVADRERLVRRTGGVPFFLISYTRAMRNVVAGGDEQRIPWTVMQTVRQRTAALPETVWDVLRVAAVVGRVVEPALLAAVTAYAEHDVLTALETAGRARLLQEEMHSYRFAHDIIREVIEADLSASTRTALYRQVAEALEQDPRYETSLERLATITRRAMCSTRPRGIWSGPAIAPGRGMPTRLPKGTTGTRRPTWIRWVTERRRPMYEKSKAQCCVCWDAMRQR